MSTKTNKAVQPRNKALAALFASMNVRTLSGFPLYEAVPGVNAVETEIVVKASKSGKLYFAIEDANGQEQLVRSTGDIYDRLTIDAEWEEGDVVLANIYLRQAIPGLKEKELEANYGPNSRNPNSAAIANYFAEAEGNYNHLYCNEIIEE